MNEDELKLCNCAECDCEILGESMTAWYSTLERTQKAEKKRGKNPIAQRFWSINTFLDETARELTRVESLTWLMLWRDSR